MTLETAKKTLQEPNGLANKEAQAVVRGGMTICEQEEGRRVYQWIKVLPTETDEESSTEQALSKYHARKYAHTLPAQSDPEPKIRPSEELVAETAPMSKPAVTSTPEKAFTIYDIIDKIKLKIREFMVAIDEIVVE